MRSHLARNATKTTTTTTTTTTANVYRRLYHAAGGLHHGLLRPGSSSVTARLPARRCLLDCSQHDVPHLPRDGLLCPRTSKRTIISLFTPKPERVVKLPYFDPGYSVLLQYRKSEVEQERPPPRDQLVTAFKKLTKFKADTKRPLNPNQAFLLTSVLKYLTATQPDADAPVNLELKDLDTAMDAVLPPPPKGNPTQFHLELAQALYKEIKSRRIVPTADLDEFLPEDPFAEVGKDFTKYIKALAQYGGAVEAANQVKEFFQKLQDENRRHTFKGSTQTWLIPLQGLANEGREEELLKFWEEAQKMASVSFFSPFHEVFVTFYAKKGDLKKTKQWYYKPIRGDFPPEEETHRELVRASQRFSQSQEWNEWLLTVFEEVTQNRSSRQGSLEAILQWSVLALDKGPDGIMPLLKMMAKKDHKFYMYKDNGKRVNVRPSTINRLIEAAMEKGNLYLAERFRQLGLELGVKPDVHTYLLHLSYRLDAKDYDGAHEVFLKLASGAIEIEFEEDLPVMNKYLRTLCAQPIPNIERIITITEALEERHATLEAETIIALCRVFLNHDKKFDVIDTLSVHSVSISHIERQQIYKSFVDYICDLPKTTTDRAWDAYSLLRQYFPETSTDDRVRMMESFFERKKPEMACLVFGHMRAHDDGNMHPTADTYVRCLEGLARSPQPDMNPKDPASSLKMVHNMLKMDTRLEMSTRLYNGLMLAYAAAGDPVGALDFWEEHITRSAEGPSYNSLAIVFWCCELIPFGDRYARPIWQKMLRMDLEVPQFVFNAYCAAVARSNSAWGKKMDEVFKLIKSTDSTLGWPASMMTLGVTYNALLRPQFKEEFAAWAEEEYPEEWARLKSKGTHDAGLEGPRFNITRPFEA
ncbi:complex I intermediate-associated protein 84, mitochondrial [Sordaria brevicollis]|uniref:Complex I intermediate-associated protein 84, mitochondrial n=1 Tax=Sordaria brevicollis TaxID=83679 RepID=A0AAE0UGK4_SORBR|nr:complex I intermediate-associated protein 84, mitochondrial [Sordaria brevicollis]